MNLRILKGLFSKKGEEKKEGGYRHFDVGGQLLDELEALREAAKRRAKKAGLVPVRARGRR